MIIGQLTKKTKEELIIIIKGILQENKSLIKIRLDLQNRLHHRKLNRVNSKRYRWEQLKLKSGKKFTEEDVKDWNKKKKKKLFSLLCSN